MNVVAGCRGLRSEAEQPRRAPIFSIVNQRGCGFAAIHGTRPVARCRYFFAGFFAGGFLGDGFAAGFSAGLVVAGFVVGGLGLGFGLGAA